MKGSDLGRGFSWNALQERGLDYNLERDRPAIEATRQRADTAPTKAVEAPTISTPAPEYGVTDFVKDAGRAAGQYVLDQVNPVQQIQNQAQMVQQVGQTIVEGYYLAKEFLTKDNSIENLQRAAEVQPDSRNAFERLQQATGMESSTTAHDALERLSETVGMNRKDPLADLTQSES